MMPNVGVCVYCSYKVKETILTASPKVLSSAP